MEGNVAREIARKVWLGMRGQKLSKNRIGDIRGSNSVRDVRIGNFLIGYLLLIKKGSDLVFCLDFGM